MNTNWHEISSHSRSMVDQRRQEAEAYRLAKIAAEQVEHAHTPVRGGKFQALRELMARLWRPIGFSSR